MKKILVIIFLGISFNQDVDLLEASKSNENSINNDAWKLNLYCIGGGVLPLGQLENNKPLKALSLFALKAYWIDQMKKSTKGEKDDISDRNRSFWWLFFLYFYGIIDAYVDSHMEDFPENIDENINNMEKK